MNITTIINIVIVTLILVHFGIPLSYFLYAKHRWLKLNWNIKENLSYMPEVTIIIPTYNEARYIKKKLENIEEIDYPTGLLNLIVVDSSSTDGTQNIVREWLSKNKIKATLVEEKERKGKLYAIFDIVNKIAHEKNGILIITDADSFFPSNSIRELVKHFSDPMVGVVTASIYYIDDNSIKKQYSENTYRSFYNLIRVAESKHFSTPIHNGPFQAFRCNVIKKIGLPDFPGADDSAFGSYVAFSGYKAIQSDRIYVYEPIENLILKRKIRRAQTLILNFLYTKKFVRKRGFYKKTEFEHIWKIEYFLTIINPWFIFLTIMLLIYSIIFLKNFIGFFILLVGALLLKNNAYKIWILQQLYLIIGFIKNLWKKPVVWED